MSDWESALRAVASLNQALMLHVEARIPPASQSLFESLNNWYHSVTKKVESIELSKELVGSGVWVRFGEMGQNLPAGLELLEVRAGFLHINLNAKDANTFLLSTFEHLVSSAKNVTDVYAVLLNELWQLNLRGNNRNLERVAREARLRNNVHPFLPVADALKPQGTWFSVANDVRNACQHRDSTGILITRVGRNVAPCIDKDLCPAKSELDRSLNNFCPWLADQAYRFIEAAGAALSANPQL